MRGIVELIAHKRDGGRHDADEIALLVQGHAAGDVPDYQMAAWLMAAFLNGLDAEETVHLTDAMVKSGRRVDLSSVEGVVLDKHSTGGVGDAVTLVAIPLVSACGVPVAKMSGRGLGHTGGTVDKLESIPGLRTELSIESYVRQVERVGMAVIAQSPEVDPADKAIYALRDVTATVPSIPLIVASIASKKIAGGAGAVLLDVKVGSGAFMRSKPEARRLAGELRRVGEALGCRMVSVLTDMSAPLAAAVGNALEIREALEVLSGAGSPRLSEASIAVAGRMLVLGGAARDAAEGESGAAAALADGSGLQSFTRLIEAQGGDPKVAEDTSLLPASAMTREVRATSSGYLSHMDAQAIGFAAVSLGAGRSRKGERLDPGAGIEFLRLLGDPVKRGEPVARLHASSVKRLDEGEARLVAALTFAEETPQPIPVLLHDPFSPSR